MVVRGLQCVLHWSSRNKIALWKGVFTSSRSTCPNRFRHKRKMKSEIGCFTSFLQVRIEDDVWVLDVLTGRYFWWNKSSFCLFFLVSLHVALMYVNTGFTHALYSFSKSILLILSHLIHAFFQSFYPVLSLQSIDVKFLTGHFSFSSFCNTTSVWLLRSR